MRRALAALTVAAFLTLLVDAGGWGSLLAGFLFTAVSVSGSGWVERRSEVRLSYAYILVLMVLGFAVFVLSGASIGAILMLVVLVVRATMLLPVAAVVVVVVALPFFHTGMAVADGVREGLGLFAVAVFAAVLTKLLMREQKARAALARAQLKVERLAALEERTRVARDIHDGLGHALTVVQMQIKAARAVLAARPERADEMLGKAQEQAEEALREVRRSVGALREARPSVPLPSALKDLASAAEMPARVEVTGDVRPLRAEAEETLFRAAQEGLTNVRKHAHATEVALVLDYSDPAAVRLEVRDDGAGVTAGPSGFGLVGLRERAAQLGGSVALEPSPGGGATLRMEVPG